jgi:hypothetical protein
MKPPLPVSKPCPADWNAMTGDDRKRLCAQCDKHVHNLSALTPRKLRRFVEQRDGSECVSYVVRQDGSMVTAPRWEWLWRWLRPLRMATAWVLALVVPSLFAACARHKRLGGAVCPTGKSHVEQWRTGGSIAPPAPGEVFTGPVRPHDDGKGKPDGTTDRQKRDGKWSIGEAPTVSPENGKGKKR